MKNKQRTVLQLVADYLHNDLFKSFSYKVVFNKDKTKFVILYDTLSEMMQVEYGVNKDCVFIYYYIDEDFQARQQARLDNQNFGIPVYIL